MPNDTKSVSVCGVDLQQQTAPAADEVEATSSHVPQLSAPSLNVASVVPPSLVVTDDDWQQVTPAPWRRYIARMLDTVILGGVVWFAIGLVTAAFASSSYEAWFGKSGTATNIFIAQVLTFFFVLPMETLLIGLTGTTIGKWLTGVRVTRVDGHPIGLGPALGREMRVFVQGLAAGLPLISLITLITAYGQLKSNGVATWDKDRPWIVTYRPDGVLQTFLFGLAIFLWLSVLVAVRVMRSL